MGWGNALIMILMIGCFILGVLVGFSIGFKEKYAPQPKRVARKTAVKRKPRIVTVKPKIEKWRHYSEQY